MIILPLKVIFGTILKYQFKHLLQTQIFSGYNSTEMDESFDNDDTYSLPEISVNDVENRLNNEPLESQEREHERIGIEQRFSEIVQQIGELARLVRILTEWITSNT